MTKHRKWVDTVIPGPEFSQLAKHEIANVILSSNFASFQHQFITGTAESVSVLVPLILLARGSTQSEVVQCADLPMPNST